MSQLTPADIGLPSKFVSWRPGQWSAIDTSLSTDKRFLANCAPTGFGKTGYYVAVALLGGGRTVALTSTKALQDQAYGDFSACGMADMRGRQNYNCVQMSDGTCSDGRIAGCRDAGCPYRAYNEDFLRSRLALTNYSYFFSSTMNAEGVGDYDTLVLDEAHNAVQELSNALEIHLNHDTYEIVYHWLGYPPRNTNISQYRTWAKWLLPKAQTKFKEFKESNNIRYLRLMDSFILCITRISDVAEDWILDESNSSEALFAPLWPTDHAHPLLFRDTPHLILTSATLVPKTLELLNISQEQSLFLSQNYNFDVRRCPVYLYGSHRIDNKTSEGQFAQTIGDMDNIISGRLDRKGLIHPVSYDRQEQILQQSNYRGLMITPRKSSELKRALEEFRASEPPRLFLAPAITTGYDFPGPEAEYQFIFKVPFIDQRPPIMAARNAADKEYLPYLTAQTLTQTAGRIMRGPNDQGETFILDAHANWFTKGRDYKGRGGYRHLFPAWFLRQLKYSAGVPIPPPPLPPDWRP